MHLVTNDPIPHDEWESGEPEPVADEPADLGPALAEASRRRSRAAHPAGQRAWREAGNPVAL